MKQMIWIYLYCSFQLSPVSGLLDAWVWGLELTCLAETIWNLTWIWGLCYYSHGKKGRTDIRKGEREGERGGRKEGRVGVVFYNLPFLFLFLFAIRCTRTYHGADTIYHSIVKKTEFWSSSSVIYITRVKKDQWERIPCPTLSHASPWTAELHLPF